MKNKKNGNCIFSLLRIRCLNHLNFDFFIDWFNLFYEMSRINNLTFFLYYPVTMQSIWTFENYLAHMTYMFITIEINKFLYFGRMLIC